MVDFDVHMESPAPTPSRPPGSGAALADDAPATSMSVRDTMDSPPTSPIEEDMGGTAAAAAAGGFDYFDALDVELERRILRQLSHEVRDETRREGGGAHT